MSRNYTTIQGDMWDSVAFSQLGSVSYTDRLINANQQYRDYYIFPAGLSLTLPAIDVKADDNLPPWKKAPE